MFRVTQTFHQGRERDERVIELESLSRDDVAGMVRDVAGPGAGERHIERAVDSILGIGLGELGWTTWEVQTRALEGAELDDYLAGRTSYPFALETEHGVTVPAELLSCAWCEKTFPAGAGDHYCGYLREDAPRCSCARHIDGSVTTSMCPAHADTDPCLTMSLVTGCRRKGSIRRGVCSNCGHGRSVD